MTWDHITIEHGARTGYERHRRLNVPFPEDNGGEPCGCRATHRDANRATRAARGERTLTCPICGIRRAVRKGRGNVCAECWIPPPEEDVDSPDELGEGRWVREGLVMRWYGAETRTYALPDGRYWRLGDTG